MSFECLHELGLVPRWRCTATLGRAPAHEDIQSSLASFHEQVIVEQLTNDEMVQTVSEALAQGSIVARFEGGCEFGPRALGHRSIVADPTFPRMKDIINARVKLTLPLR